MEIDARGLNFPPKDAGDALEGMPGLPAAVKGGGNGKPGIACALEADDVGNGGEKGSGG